MAFFGKYYFTATYRHASSKPGQVVEDMLRPQREITGDIWQPPTDIYETGDGVVVRIELAGVDERAIDIEASGDALAIRGRRREQCVYGKKSYCQMEIHYGPFERVLHLPRRFDADRARASYTHGILEIFLPWSRESCSREVRIVVNKDND